MSRDLVPRHGHGPGPGTGLGGLGAEDDDELGAVELARDDPVEWPDEADAEVGGEALALREAAGAVHDDGSSVAPRCVRGPADWVPARVKLRGGGGGRSGDPVP